MYTSWSEVLGNLNAWRRQRFSSVLFVPVAITLVVASLVAVEWPTVQDLTARFAAAWLAVFTLRLWDDLEDVDRDRKYHPERVLTQIANLRPFVLIVGTLFLFVAFVVSASGGEMTVWLVLISALAIFYRLNMRTKPLADFGVLLKYPMLVLALGGSLQPAGLSVLALVFSAVVMDEMFQRPTVEPSQVVGGTVGLVGSAISLLVFINPPNHILALQVALIIAMSALCIQSLFGEPLRTLRRAGLLAATFFILLLCSVSNFSEVIHAC